MSTFKRFTFPSLTDPDVRFTLDLTYNIDAFMELYRMNAGDPLGAPFCYFRTLGDGDTQHTPEHFITTYNMAADYLLSFGAAVQARVQTHYQMPPDLLGAVVNALDRAFQCPSPGVIRSAFKNPYKPGKARYLNVSTFDVTTSASRAHDKRYLELHPTHSGTVDGVLRLLLDADRVRNGHESAPRLHLMERMVRAEAVCAIAPEFDQYGYGPANTATKLDLNDPLREQLDTGFSTFRTAYDVLRNLHRLSRIVQVARPAPAPASTAPDATHAPA